MSDLRLELAQEVAEQIAGAKLYQGRCECGWPLMVKPDQQMPFCWDCAMSRLWAQSGHALLVKAELKAKGIHIQSEEYSKEEANPVIPYIPAQLEKVDAPIAKGHIDWGEYLRRKSA